MSFHFAVARSSAHSPVARALALKALGRAANDNCDVPDQAGSQDVLLKAALRHFGQHGMGAAREARKQAEQAYFAGDRQSYEWWLGICRQLDKRLADQFEAATIAN